MLPIILITIYIVGIIVWMKIEKKCFPYKVGVNVHHILAFKTRKLRDEFLNNFKDLIETAKPLI